MKVGMSTASFFPWDTMHSIEEMAKMGVTTCEVFFNTYSEYKQGFIEQLKRATEANGIKVHSVHAMTTQFEPQLFTSHDNQYNDALNVFLKVADAAEMLDAKFYTFHGQAFYKRRAHNNYERVAERLFVLTQQLKERELNLSLENVYWATFNEPSKLAEIKKHNELNDLYYTLDIKQAAQSNYDTIEYIQAMGSKISTVHLCDYVQKDSYIDTCLPGKGEVDFSLLKKEIESVCAAPEYIVEVYKGDYENIDELKNSTIYLENIIK